MDMSHVVYYWVYAWTAQGCSVIAMAYNSIVASPPIIISILFNCGLLKITNLCYVTCKIVKCMLFGFNDQMYNELHVLYSKPQTLS